MKYYNNIKTKYTENLEENEEEDDEEEDII